jgi:NADH-quinone oxidoreductase subunit L
MTHAFFKALLFLGAGSVIHGLAGIHDIRKMGGLRRHMPWTHYTFLAGTLAIAGIPGFAGFFSKDAILWAAWNNENYGALLWAIALVAAGFTSFYTFRLVILTFYGSARYAEHEVHHVHEAPPSMLVPLVILAILATFGGYVGIPPVLGGHNQIEVFLGAPAHDVESEAVGATAVEGILLLLSVAVSMGGLGVAYLFYVARPELPSRIVSSARGMYAILLNKYYVDEIYDAVIVWPIASMSRDFLWKFMDAFVIDGTINNLGRAIRGTGGGLKYMQTGYVRTYAGWILFGGVLVVAWFLT